MQSNTTRSQPKNRSQDGAYGGGCYNVRILHWALVGCCVLLWCCCAASASLSDPSDPPTSAAPSLSYKHPEQQQTQQLIESLQAEAEALPTDSLEYRQKWEEILALDPNHMKALLALGWSMVNASLQKNSKDEAQLEYGMSILQEAFEETHIAQGIDLQKNPNMLSMAAMIGRYRANPKKQNHALAQRFLLKAFELEKGFYKDSPKHYQDPLCIAMQLGTLLEAYPPTPQAANDAIEVLTHYCTAWLSRPITTVPVMSAIRPILLDPEIPDAYTHCMLDLFAQLKYYHRAPVAQLASVHYQMALRMWPAMYAIAPYVDRIEQEQRNSAITETEQSLCVSRKLKMAVICTTYSEDGPDALDFGGVLQRLDRTWAFSVTYIYLHENAYSGAEHPPPQLASFTRVHDCSDIVWMWLTPDLEDGGTLDASWIAWAWEQGPLFKEEFDIALFMDLTSHTYARRLGMQRLAPVQFTTHGGNTALSSGHDRSIIQYYISWEGAEHSLDVSQSHYTEELILMPSKHMHLYYEPSIIENDEGVSISRLDEQPFEHLTVIQAGLRVPTNIHLDYLTHQHLYLALHPRFHSEWDSLMCSILEKDPDGYFILHTPTGTASAQDVLEMRLEVSGCDLERVLFWDSEKVSHSQRLALYRQATVVLDTYPAGTTVSIRDVLELSQPIVTMPGRLLGGRWTFGYYQAMDLNPTSLLVLIAQTEREYVHNAVKLGTDEILREEVRADLAKNVPRHLFREKRAVETWQNILLGQSLVQPCEPEKKPDYDVIFRDEL